MVSTAEARAANDALKKTHRSITAVFTGATNGIGLGTLRAFIKHVPEPKVFIIGRSASKFAAELENLRSSNANAELTFIEGQVALIKGVDAVTEQMKQQGVSNIDLLCMSQGYVSFVKKEMNVEGLDNRLSVGHYGRIRLAQNLLPLMSPNARVVSILGAGQEGPLFEDNMDLSKPFAFTKALGHFTSLMTLSLDGLEQRYPDKLFMHVHPGSVGTGMFGRSNTGVLGMLFRWVLDPAFNLLAMTIDDCGERMLCFAFDSQRGNGSYSVDKNGNVVETSSLAELRRNGWAKKVLEHNEEVFSRVLSN